MSKKKKRSKKPPANEPAARNEPAFPGITNTTPRVNISCAGDTNRGWFVLLTLDLRDGGEPKIAGRCDTANVQRYTPTDALMQNVIKAIGEARGHIDAAYAKRPAPIRGSKARP